MTRKNSYYVKKVGDDVFEIRRVGYSGVDFAMTVPMSGDSTREELAKYFSQGADARELPPIDWEEAYDKGYYTFAPPGPCSENWSKRDWMGYVTYTVPVSYKGIAARAPYQSHVFIVTDEAYREAYDEYLERRAAYNFTASHFEGWLRCEKTKGN